MTKLVVQVIHCGMNHQHKYYFDNYYSASFGRFIGPKNGVVWTFIGTFGVFWHINMMKGPIVSQLCEQRISRTKKILKMNFTGFSHHNFFFYAASALPWRSI